MSSITCSPKTFVLAFESKSVSLSVVVMLGLGGVTRARALSLDVAATKVVKLCSQSANSLAVAPIK